MEDYEFLDNIRGIGFDLHFDVSANGRATVWLKERGDENNNIVCSSPTRVEAYQWIGQKIEQLIEGRKEMVLMAERTDNDNRRGV